MPLALTSFQLTLLAQFGSKLQANWALANIVNLTQGLMSVRAYFAEFELNVGRLDSSDKATLMQFLYEDCIRILRNGYLLPIPPPCHEQ